MKILYYHQYFCTEEGNAGIRSYKMAEHLVNVGHTVTMVFGQSPRLKSPLEGKRFKNGIRKGKYNGINLIELKIYYANKMSFIRRAIAFIKFSFLSLKFIFTEEYDLVFATSTPLTTGIPGIVMKIFRKKIPFVFEVRDLWPDLPREMGLIKSRFILSILYGLESLTYNKADICIALAPGIKAGIEKKLKNPKKVYFIPNGCDLELFKPGLESKTIFPCCTDNDFIAIFIGAHGLANGLDILLKVSEILLSSASNIKIVLIGDGKLKPYLVQKAQAKKLTNLIFLDPVPKNKLIHYMHAADIGLMLLSNIPAFYYGTSPNKFFDYISAGLPVLNNYPGWLAELIKENKIGMAIEPDNPTLFANTLIKLSKDNYSLQKMRENARKLAETDFDRRKLAIEFEMALKEAYKIYNNN